MSKQNDFVMGIGGNGLSFIDTSENKLGDENKVTPLEKDLNTFYEKFHRKGKSVDSNEWGLVYHNVPLGLSKDFKTECEKIINENNLNLKAELVSENGVFVNQCVIYKK